MGTFCRFVWLHYHITVSCFFELVYCSCDNLLLHNSLILLLIIIVSIFCCVTEMTTETSKTGDVPPVTLATMVSPTIVALASAVVPLNHSEKPEKFNGTESRRWQQKMLFYLTTLHLARFL